MEDRPPEGAPFRLLFVCTGNTCRSPMAEAIARRAADRLGWSHLEVRSAGAGAYAGSPASGGAARTAAAHGLDLSSHLARLLTEEEVAAADLILTMSSSHLVRAHELGGGAKAAMLTAFASGEDDAVHAPSVPDPIGGPDAEYEQTFVRLEELIEHVMNRLQPVLAP